MSVFKKVKSWGWRIGLGVFGVPPAFGFQKLTVSEMKVEGNHTVQAEAILGLMNIKSGVEFSAEELNRDAQSILRSGYFSDLQMRMATENGKTVLVVQVKEKPTLAAIRFEGFLAVSSSTFQDKLLTKRYTIADEQKLESDKRLLEQLYTEKGYYLAQINYRFDEKKDGSVELVFTVAENLPLRVRRIHLLGNHFFSDQTLKGGLATRERRSTSWLSSGGIFKDEFIQRDKEYLSYFLMDNGFAEAKVGLPQTRLDASRSFVDVGFAIEEGERFFVNKVEVSGELIKPAKEILSRLKLTPTKVFRISHLHSDLRTLQDIYGDEGYAFADVVPKTTANNDTRTIDIEFVMTKGEKAYFRNIVVEGNTKTRDNVVRRNIKVAEGDRFHATRLDASRSSVERLGFFQDVTVVREPDVANRSVDLRVKVKEKSTGSFNLSIGASPTSNGNKLNFMVQTSYNEANLLGKGWATGLDFQMRPNNQDGGDLGQNYEVSMYFAEPSINDGPWSLRLGANVSRSVEKDQGQRVESKAYGASVSVGRELIEDLRLSGGYSIRSVENDTPLYLKPYFNHGITETLNQSLTYDITDNYLAPTSGVYASLSNNVGAKIFAGEHYFGKITLSNSWYIPVPFTETFKTNFRLVFEPGYVYALSPNRSVPVWEQFRLGNNFYMKAYGEENSINPTKEVPSPAQLDKGIQTVEIGGNRRLYGAVEYFVPLIPEANLRSVFFYEAGSVFAPHQKVRWDDFKHDVGFGFRWQTPIAPFRFEWAFPLTRKPGGGMELGTSQFVFMVGGDNQSFF